MTITWTASSGISLYRIKRTLTSGIGYSTVGETNGTSWTDTNVGYVPGLTYYYVLVAVAAGVEGTPSSEVPYIAPSLSAPTLSVIADGLSWSAVTGATGYLILTSPTGTITDNGYNFTEFATVSGGMTTTWTTPSAYIPPGSYVVVALQDQWQSPHSNIVGV